MIEQLLHNRSIPLFFTALFLSLWLTPFTVRLSRRLGAVDRPGDGRKIHSRVVSRLGGLAMVAALVASLLLYFPIDGRLAGFLLGALIVCAAGFVDDLRILRPPVKFAFQAAASGVFVWVSGASLSSLGEFPWMGEVATGALAPAVTVFCMVGVMNALNLSDGLDGLAGGLCAIACVFLGFFAYLDGDRISAAILVALLGSVLGFLRYNSYPATLFMGDTGSLLLGYTLGAASVLMVQPGAGGIRLSPVTVGTVMALPIVDTLFVMLRRIRHGVNPFVPDKTHLHHRLLDIGLPHEAVVPILYVSMGAVGVLAWLARVGRDGAAFAAVLVLAGAIYGAVLAAQRLGARREGAPAGGDPRRRRSRTHQAAAAWLERTTPVVIWVIVAGLLLPAALAGPVARPVGIAAIVAAGFIAVVFPWRARRAQSGIRYGATYAACAALLASLHLAGAAPWWLPGYLAGLSAVTLGWVVLKMKFRGHKKVVLASAFETLLIGASLFVPLVIVPALRLGPGLRGALLVACAEAFCFHMAFKILARRQPGRNPVFAGAFVAALLLVGANGLLSGPPGAPATHPPASPAAALARFGRAHNPAIFPDLAGDVGAKGSGTSPVVPGR